ncbi:MAG: hypothetical protein JXX29_00145 [Deltaproteobacteria bacterium]|nr:hypothetical protein [Deltaproteobacteria bacterium]MBN2670045.1 hypothetical protein [Deltaproteobacteria bacterium]
MKLRQICFFYISFSILLTALLFTGCSSESQGPPGGISDGDADGDSDNDNDSSGDSNGGDSEDDEIVGDTDIYVVVPYLWVSNSHDGTVSKINTQEAVEEARYITCPPEIGTYCDPSRTSVNLHGDVIVTNRAPYMGDLVPSPSSVTKIIANKLECIDRNGDNIIQTSTGPDDILGWGEDECVAWNTRLPDNSGARATAWDGNTNPETGEGGNVLIGTCITGNGDLFPSDNYDHNVVYVFDGTTGEEKSILEFPSDWTLECFYGGAVDARGWVWIMDGYGAPHSLRAINPANPGSDVFARVPQCGYGIAVDGAGRVWLGGDYRQNGSHSCVSRYDRLAPTDSREQITELFENESLRGIAVGTKISAGYVWAVESAGKLYKINQETLAVEGEYIIRNLGGSNGLVGVAVDYDGYIWLVSPLDDAVYKFDPNNPDNIITVPVGDYPYTYSDMTGMQLKAAISVE